MNYFLSILSINTVQLRVAPLYGSWWQVNELLALEDERKNSSFPLLLFSAPLCSVLWLFTASFHCCLQHWLALCLFYLSRSSYINTSRERGRERKRKREIDVVECGGRTIRRKEEEEERMSERRRRPGCSLSLSSYHKLASIPQAESNYS